MIRRLMIAMTLGLLLGVATLTPAADAQGIPGSGQPASCDVCTGGIASNPAPGTSVCSLNLRWIGQMTNAICLIPQPVVTGDCLPAACAGTLILQYASTCSDNRIDLRCNGVSFALTGLPSTGGTWANAHVVTGFLGCKLTYWCDVAVLSNPADPLVNSNPGGAGCVSSTLACPDW